MPVLQTGLAKSAAADYTIDQSLRFEEGDSPYLSRTPGSASNRKTWTFSAWIKRANFGDFEAFWEAFDTSANKFYLGFDTSDRLEIWGTNSVTDTCVLVTTQVFRDPSSFYHCLVVMDTTQAVAGNRAKLYINGAQVTAFDTETQPSLNLDLWINTTDEHKIGEYSGNNSHFGGLLSEIHFVDGQALTPASFGETDSATNQWVPIEVTGMTYGTNGFYLKFQDSAALGDDSSGNTNDFTPTNLVATDQMIDTPTNSFATLNPLSTQTTTLSEGNLRKSTDAAESSSSTIGVNSGKWYWEVYPATTNFGIGVVNNTEIRMAAESNTSTVAVIYSDNTQYTPNSSQVSDTLESATAGDIYGIALDVDAETLDIYQNGTKRFEADTFTIDGPFFPSIDRGTGTTNNITINFGSDSSFAGSVTAQGNQDGNGKGDFYYEPPSGYLALCTDNLSAPEIALPTDHFNTVLYTGDGATTLAVSGVGFQPDFTWIKNRDQTDDHTLVDSVRGATNYLVSNDPDIEVDDSTFVASLDSDGFTVGDDVVVNTSTENYASWNWKAGGAASSNTDGTITSSVSANTTSGFSIGTYTGNGTAGATVGHGLSQAPELIIVKCYDGLTFNWTVGWGAGGAAWTDYMHLDTTAAAVDDLDFWRDTYPTSSVFTIGSNGNVNYNNDDFVFYAFHSVDGYSKVGSYVGNGDADGAFVYTGFKPAFVIVKRLADEGWQMFDSTRSPYNVVVDSLTPNGNGVEITYGIDVDIVSNGFKFRGDDGSCNASDDYIYIAIAKSPFQYSNAR